MAIHLWPVMNVGSLFIDLVMSMSEVKAISVVLSAKFAISDTKVRSPSSYVSKLL